MSALTSGTFGHRTTLPPAVQTLISTTRAIAASLWQAMEFVGQRRAQQHLLALARQKDVLDPALAQTLRHAAANGLME